MSDDFDPSRFTIGGVHKEKEQISFGVKRPSSSGSGVVMYAVIIQKTHNGIWEYRSNEDGDDIRYIAEANKTRNELVTKIINEGKKENRIHRFGGGIIEAMPLTIDNLGNVAMTKINILKKPRYPDYIKETKLFDALFIEPSNVPLEDSARIHWIIQKLAKLYPIKRGDIIDFNTAIRKYEMDVTAELNDYTGIK